MRVWAVLADDVRKSLVRRFPYGILYTEEQEGIFVVAVMNLHREPGQWKKRRSIPVRDKRHPARAGAGGGAAIAAYNRALPMVIEVIPDGFHESR